MARGNLNGYKDDPTPDVKGPVKGPDVNLDRIRPTIDIIWAGSKVGRIQIKFVRLVFYKTLID